MRRASLNIWQCSVTLSLLIVNCGIRFLNSLLIQGPSFKKKNLFILTYSTCWTKHVLRTLVSLNGTQSENISPALLIRVGRKKKKKKKTSTADFRSNCGLIYKKKSTLKVAKMRPWSLLFWPNLWLHGVCATKWANLFFCSSFVKS